MNPYMPRTPVRNIRFHILVLLVLVTCLSFGATVPTFATTIHSPPWSDNFHFSYTNCLLKGRNGLS